MLTKSINEFLWKTALAKGCFCFHKSSSYSFQTVFHPSDDRLSQSQMWLRLGRAVLFCSIQKSVFVGKGRSLGGKSIAIGLGAKRFSYGRPSKDCSPD